jgi:hypothetical protein
VNSGGLRIEDGQSDGGIDTGFDNGFFGDFDSGLNGDFDNGFFRGSDEGFDGSRRFDGIRLEAFRLGFGRRIDRAKRRAIGKGIVQGIIARFDTGFEHCGGFFVGFNLGGFVGFDGEHSLEFHAHGYHSLLQNIHVFS